MRWLKIAGIVALVLVGLLVGLIVYLNTADLRGPIEEAVSDATGRDFEIGGQFDLDLGKTVSLAAEDISLSNTSWGSEPEMVRVGRFAINLDLWSLISGPILIHDLEIEGARVLLESEPELGANWEFAPDQPTEPVDEAGFELGAIVAERARVEDLRFTYRDPELERPFDLELEGLFVEPGESGLLDAVLRGQVNEYPIEIAGNIGPLDNLLRGREVQHSISGSIGELQLALEGTIRDLTTLEGPNVVLEIRGPEITRIFGIFGLPEVTSGEYTVEGKIVETPEGIDLQFESRVGEIESTVTGKMDRLLSPSQADVSFDGSGPDLSALAEVFGVNGVPPGSYQFSGRLRRERDRVSFEPVSVQIGENRLKVEGTLGDPPELAGTEVTVEVSGPDLAVFNTLAGVELPAQAFSVDGRVAWKAPDIEIETLAANVGENRLEAKGTLVEPPDLLGSDIVIEASGPDLSVFSPLAGVDLPAEPFSVDGHLVRGAQNIEIETLTVKVAEKVADFSGTFGDPPELIGTDLKLRASGPDLSAVATLGGLEGLPPDPFTIEGGLALEESGYRLKTVEGSVKGNKIMVDGVISNREDLLGSDLTFHLWGGDLAAATELGGMTGAPAEPFDIAGRVRRLESAYAIDGLRADIGKNKISVDGVLSEQAGLVGTKLTIEASGPNLAEATAVADIPDAPAEPFTLSGVFELAESGYAFDQVVATVGDRKLKVSGTLGEPPLLEGTDLVIEASGPDAAEIADMAGVELPEGAFNVSGRIQRAKKGIRFEDLVADLGEFHLKIRGLLGDPPKLDGTNLDFDASGPSLTPISRAADLPELPDTPFGLRGHFDGTPEAFSLRDFDARLGEADLRGSFTLDLREKPKLTGEFYSDLLDLAPFVGPEEEDAEADVSAQEATKEKALLISDDPLPLEELDRAEVDIRLVAKRLITGRARLEFVDVNLGVHLEDQRLYLDPMAAAGPYGGTLTGTALLEPVGEAGGDAPRPARLDIDIEAKQIRPGALLGEEDRARAPPIDLTLTHRGTGASLHSIMSGSNGRLQLVQGKGQINNHGIDLVFGDFMTQLFSALNPFSKTDPYTNLECSVLIVNTTDGVAKLESLVVQTDKIGILGSGTIDFETEKIDLTWSTKSREGIGISAGIAINPFLQLGGTLANPALELNPARAVGRVATGGLTFLTKGVWDRVKGEQDLCAIALEKAAGKSTEEAGESGTRKKKKKN